MQKVPETLLVTYKGHGYSVSKKLMGKRVKIVPVANQLYIYFNTKLQCVHKISSSKFNYKKDHYCESLRSTVKGGSDREIEKRAEQKKEQLSEPPKKASIREKLHRYQQESRQQPKQTVKKKSKDRER